MRHISRFLKLHELLGESLLKPQRDSRRSVVEFGAAVPAGNRAFPDHADAPALPQKSGDVALVPLSVSGELFEPERLVRARHTEFSAVVGVPEAAVHKYHRMIMRKNDVRAAREPPVVLSEAETEPEQLRAQRGLKLSADAPDCGHILVPLLGSERVAREVEAGNLGVRTAQKERRSDNPRGLWEVHRGAEVLSFLELAFSQLGSERDVRKKALWKIIPVPASLKARKENPVRRFVQSRYFLV